MERQGRVLRDRLVRRSITRLGGRAAASLVGQTQDAKVLLLVKKNLKYLLVFEIFRFVTEDQQPGFSLLVDGERVPLMGYAKTEHSGPGGGIFAANLGRRPSEHCSITFHVDCLKSLHDANPEDPDKTPLGLALASMIS